MSEFILEMKDITKLFSGVKALNQVNLKIKHGEIHALCGENGAGKSTLMKVLSGVYPYGEYEGTIVFDNQECQFKGINDSEELGIVIIHQELALIPHLSIAENIFLGNEIAQYGIIDFDETIKKSEELLDRVGLKEQPNTLITNIGVGKQQLVEIAKAMSKNVKVLILDEPTAALNEADSQNLLALLLECKKQGITCIIISHKLNEVMTISDTVTIIRDGKTIETLQAHKEELSETRIIKGMVGRSLDHRYPEYTPIIGGAYFEVRNWQVHDPIHPDRKILDGINLTIKKGEIIGIAGLMGSGRTELARSIFGKSYGTKISGQLFKDGKELYLPNVKKAIDEGIAYATEDRKGNGLVLNESINENISLASLNQRSKATVIDENEEIKQSEYYKEKMNIKSRNAFQEVGSLSGGNQQKVVLAKWLLSEPDVYF